ncbi:Ank domain-containing protein/Ank_2 domain-containing protein, partial [Cephalotus follicularis]
VHDAAAMNRMDIIEFLCAKFKDIDVNSVDGIHGRTPIHIAACHGHVEVIKFCVSIGGNPEVLDCNGWSPLHLASENGHLEAVECLLSYSKYGKYQVNNDGKTAFMFAVENGHSHLYDILQLGDVLHRAAKLDDVNGIKSCLAEGARVNGRDQNGWTPLHRATFKGRIESVRALLSHGAMVDLVDDVGYTALDCAVEAGHVKVALLLIAHGARANFKSAKGVAPLNKLECFKSHPSLVQPLCSDKERA